MQLAPASGSTIRGARFLVSRLVPRRVDRAVWFRPGFAAILLALVACLGAALVATLVFDRLPHVEDDVIFLFQARTIASGLLRVPAPPLPEFFPIPFTLLRDGFWFGKYPPGYPAVLALGVIAGQPWLLNPVLAAACVGVLYFLGRRLYGSGTALVAAALLAASPFFLLQSGSFMSHTSALLWALLFTMFFVKSRGGGMLVAVFAGGSLGMLFLSRQLTGVGIGIPFAVWGIVDLLRERTRWRQYGAMLLGFIPFAVAVLAYNNLTTGNPLRSAYELYWPYDRVGFGPGIGSNGEHTMAAAVLDTGFNMDALATYLFGWPLRLSLLPAAIAVVVAILNLALLLYRPLSVGRGVQRAQFGRDVLLGAVAASLILVHGAYWTTGQMYGPRYYFEAIGALALLSARGVTHTRDAVAWALSLLRSGRADVRRLSTSVVAVFTCILFAIGYGSFVPREFGKFVGWYDINGNGVRAVEAAHIHDALVFVKYDYWTDYAPFFSQNSPLLDGDIVYAVDLGLVRDRELTNLYPGRSYYRFADDRVEPLTP